MKRAQTLVDSLKQIQSRLEEIEENYEQDYDAALDELDQLNDKVGEIADELYAYEDHLFSSKSKLDGFVDNAESCHSGRILVDKIGKKIADIRYEITGYDERETLQMMYPDDDIDSEDFEDGFDIEDFYED